ncbi:hypothetical protein HHUSO_G9126 [Huso huso]|uniref:Uncharacterized protein n=1 Tax=Huso huso TaxID=61971 RepID=A0ABR0ZSP0_HUSHU
MKTFLLLTSLLAVALVSQAAEVKLNLDDGLGKALLDLASGGQQKREEGFEDDSDESQGEKRELGFADNSDESQGEKRESKQRTDFYSSPLHRGENEASDFVHDERDLLGQKGKLDGLVDDLEQKREMGECPSQSHRQAQAGCKTAYFKGSLKKIANTDLAS